VKLLTVGIEKSEAIVQEEGEERIEKRCFRE
jgi:hypothetical protein